MNEEPTPLVPLTLAPDFRDPPNLSTAKVSIKEQLKDVFYATSFTGVSTTCILEMSFTPSTLEFLYNFAVWISVNCLVFPLYWKFVIGNCSAAVWHMRTVLIGIHLQKVRRAFATFATFGAAFGVSSAGVAEIYVSAFPMFEPGSNRGGATSVFVIMSLGWLIGLGAAGFVCVARLFRLSRAADSMATVLVPSSLIESVRRAPPTASVVHLTDLHLTGHMGERRIESGADSLRSWNSVLSKFMDHFTSAELLVVTGDVTDSGQSEQWGRFIESLDRIKVPVVLLPGNHDINLASSKIEYTIDRENIGRKIRCLRFLAAVDRSQGEYSYILHDNRLVPFRAHLSNYKSDIDAFVERIPECEYHYSPYAGEFPLFSVSDLKILGKIDALWRACFPMVVAHPCLPFVVVCCDSSNRSRNLITNALGLLGASQISRLRQMLNGFEENAVPVVLALHHQLAAPSYSDSLTGSIQSRFLTLADSVEFLRALSGRRYVLLTGHRHASFAAYLRSNVEAFSAPSTTLGGFIHCAEEDNFVGFQQYRLVTSRDGDVSVERITCMFERT